MKEDLGMEDFTPKHYVASAILDSSFGFSNPKISQSQF